MVKVSSVLGSIKGKLFVKSERVKEVVPQSVAAKNNNNIVLERFAPEKC